MQHRRILLGLQRASWLFALASGLATAVIIVTSNRHNTWDDPDDYIAGSFIAAVIAFFAFRIGIWVFIRETRLILRLVADDTGREAKVFRHPPLMGFEGIMPAAATDLADAYSHMGYVLHNLRRHEEAISAYKSAIAIKPDDADAYYDWHMALAELDRFEEASVPYQRAISIDPNGAAAKDRKMAARLSRAQLSKGPYGKMPGVDYRKWPWQDDFYQRF